MRRLALMAILLAGCTETIDAGGSGVDAGVDGDPLASIPTDDYEPGSLDEIQQTIIQKRCSGQPGLCHNGQFEPNLSTAANTYAYLVGRPALEKRDLMRVVPGEPDASFLIDKLRNRDVDTQMPLGADPLAEAEIALIEGWIEDGARRTPDADPVELLNNPPATPEIAVFDGAARLDLAGPFAVSVGQQLTLRQSVQDFETADSAIPFAIFIMAATDGRQVLLGGGDAGNLGIASYDAAGPQGAGDALNYRFAWTVPATVDLLDEATGAVTPDVPTTGQVFSIAAAYVDGFTAGESMGAFDFALQIMRVE